jgi:hypothetical protein
MIKYFSVEERTLWNFPSSQFFNMSQEMKDAILKVVSEYSNVSFLELEQKVKGFRGDAVYRNGSLIFWPEISGEAAQAIIELVDSDRVVATPTTVEVYMLDGGLPAMTDGEFFPLVFNVGGKPE